MLGDNIRLLRSVRGISQVELGEKLRCGFSTSVSGEAQHIGK